MSISMKNIVNQCNQMKVGYIKQATSGNDPSITKSKRFSEYTNIVKPKKQYNDTYAYLDNRGLTYTPVHSIFLVPTTIDIINNPPIIFPREHIYIKSIQH